MEERWQEGVLATSRRALIDAQGTLVERNDPERARALHRAVSIPATMMNVEEYIQNARKVMEECQRQAPHLRDQFVLRAADQLSDAIAQCHMSPSPHPWLQPVECLKHWDAVFCAICCCLEWKDDPSAPVALIRHEQLGLHLSRLERSIWAFLKHVRFLKMPICAVDKKDYDLSLDALRDTKKPRSNNYELPRAIRRIVWQCLCGIQYWNAEYTPALAASTLQDILNTDSEQLDGKRTPLDESKSRPFEGFSPQLQMHEAPESFTLPTRIPLRLAHRTLDSIGVSDISALMYAYSEQWYSVPGRDHRLIKCLWMRLCECMMRDDIALSDPFLVVSGEPTEYFYLEMERHFVRHMLLKRELDQWTHMARRTQGASQILSRGSVPEGVWNSHAAPSLPAALHLPRGFKTQFCQLMQRLSMNPNWYSILRDKLRNIVMDTALLPHEIEKQHDVSPSLAPKAKVVIHAARPKDFEYIAEVALDDRCLDRLLSLSHGERLDLEDVSLSQRDPSTGMVLPLTSVAGASPEILELRRAFARRALPMIVQQMIHLVDPTNRDLIPRIHTGQGDACTLALGDIYASPHDVSPHIVECRGEYAIVMRAQAPQGAMLFQTPCFIHALYVWHAAWAWRFGSMPRGALFVEPFKGIMTTMIRLQSECKHLYDTHI